MRSASRPRRAVLALALGLVLAEAAARAEPVPPSTRQLVVVTSDGWRADHGELARWERDGRSWRRVGAAVPVVLGRAGLGWGAGEDDDADRGTAPRKREGDLRAPAGVFALDDAFGLGAAPPGVRLPYRATTATLLCIDDPASADYGRIVETAAARPHASAEHLRSSDDEYALAVVIGHNRARLADAGSCVFLHVWAAPGTPTTGCTALDRAALVEVVRWLDPAQRPRLVQLPRAVYAARRARWGLP